MNLVLNQEIALVILCQSLKPDERLGVSATIRAAKPRMKILIMEPDELSPILAAHEEVVNALLGPGVLLAAVNRMLGITSPSLHPPKAA